MKKISLTEKQFKEFELIKNAVKQGILDPLKATILHDELISKCIRSHAVGIAHVSYKDKCIYIEDD